MINRAIVCGTMLSLALSFMAPSLAQAQPTTGGHGGHHKGRHHKGKKHAKKSHGKKAKKSHSRKGNKSRSHRGTRGRG